MSKSQLAGQNSSGTDPRPDLEDRLAESFTIGVDAESFDHHYYRSAHAVVRYNYTSGEVERVRYLDDEPLVKWLAFVASEIGWSEFNVYGLQGVAVIDELDHINPNDYL